MILCRQSFLPLSDKLVEERIWQPELDNAAAAELKKTSGLFNIDQTGLISIGYYRLGQGKLRLSYASSF